MAAGPDRPSPTRRPPRLRRGVLLILLLVALGGIGWFSSWRFGRPSGVSPVQPAKSSLVLEQVATKASEKLKGFYTAEPTPEPPAPIVNHVPAPTLPPEWLQTVQELRDMQREQAAQIQLLAAAVAKLRERPESTPPPMPPPKPTPPPKVAVAPKPAETAESKRQRKLEEERKRKEREQELQQWKSDPWQRKSEVKDSPHGLKVLPTAYSLAPGWSIPCAIRDRLTNQSPGISRIFVTADVMDSATGQYLIIPSGSTIMVDPPSATITGDTRLTVKPTWLIFPNGNYLPLRGAKAGDQEGTSGFADQIDHRWGSLLLSILVNGVLEGGSSLVVGYGGDAPDRIAGGIAAETSSQGSKVAKQVIKTEPIMFERPGLLCEVTLNEPLVFEKPYVF